jgi:hypothetical protein
MTDERLRRAAVALERSVAELDPQRRLVELGRRHRRRRLTIWPRPWWRSRPCSADWSRS